MATYKDPNKHAGRPLMYKTVEELDAAIEKYFSDCAGEILKDKDGDAVLDKYGKPVIYGEEPITVTGLALALGFSSRTGLLNYEDKKEFVYSVTRAKNRCQQYAEKRLYDSQGGNGAKFSLQNNFGWREKTEVDSVNRNLNQDVDGLTDAELDAQIAALEAQRAAENDA